MKYVGTVFKEVIVAKGINYTDIINENEIELTEAQYNNIPIPCKLVDGEFIACDFPYIAESIEGYCGNAKIATGSYVGTGKYGSSNPTSITVNGKPAFVIISTLHQYALGDPNLSGLSVLSTASGSWKLIPTVTEQANGTYKISWYLPTGGGVTQNGGSQMNNSGTTYYYTVLMK